ncbi:Abi family protein [Fructobacillus sp. M1-13]|uniref:Abi family protein n=1 Tax=Fructobacillus papyriferae TaxID=2713171 RepID=A0ABS5QQ70_9LACO|nr:Abi family protein [Fructobacillus papyriferae]MBS9335338.1 Abi family protein [Fructobacillus papyriferae]MCD2158993.1 Abi family protein [Fructobacillus papyriferae]
MTAFLDWPEQIELLKAHNLHIESETTALNTIQKYSFHALINGYLPALAKEDHPEQFIDGISIETLGVIQMLENRLASELLQAIISIERNVKSVFQHEISRQLGHDPKDYLQASHYRSRGVNRTNNLRMLDGVAKKSKALLKTIPYLQDEQPVTPWILINQISFGHCLNWYMMSEPTIKRRTVTHFDLPFEDEASRLEFFKDAMSYLVAFRNGLAHGRMIGQIKSRIPLHYHRLHVFYSESVLSKKEFQNDGYGQRDFFGLLLVIGVFLKQSERQIFKDQLQNLLEIFDTLLPLDERPMQNIFGGIPNALQERVEELL